MIRWRCWLLLRSHHATTTFDARLYCLPSCQDGSAMQVEAALWRLLVGCLAASQSHEMMMQVEAEVRRHVRENVGAGRAGKASAPDSTGPGAQHVLTCVQYRRNGKAHSARSEKLMVCRLRLRSGGMQRSGGCGSRQRGRDKRTWQPRTWSRHRLQWTTCAAFDLASCRAA